MSISKSIRTFLLSALTVWTLWIAVGAGAAAAQTLDDAALRIAGDMVAQLSVNTALPRTAAWMPALIRPAFASPSGNNSVK